MNLSGTYRITCIYWKSLTRTKWRKVSIETIIMHPAQIKEKHELKRRDRRKKPNQIFAKLWDKLKTRNLGKQKEREVVNCNEIMALDTGGIMNSPLVQKTTSPTWVIISAVIAMILMLLCTGIFMHINFKRTRSSMMHFTTCKKLIN